MDEYTFNAGCAVDIVDPLSPTTRQRPCGWPSLETGRVPSRADQAWALCNMGTHHPSKDLYIGPGITSIALVGSFTASDKLQLLVLYTR